MNEWHHRPTWPEDPRTHATDRHVAYGEDPVGRIMRIDGGPQNGRWRWTGIWVGWDNAGTAETLEEGLQALREAYIHMLETDPRRCVYSKGSPYYRETPRPIPPRS